MATTPAQAFPYPTGADNPDVPGDMQALALAIERRVVGVYNNSADRDSKITSAQEGQVAYLKDTNTFYFYTGSTWQAMFGDTVLPHFTAGTAAPTGGTDGDVYFRYS